MVSHELLFKYGFLNEDGRKLYGSLSIQERDRLLKEVNLSAKEFVNFEMQERASSVLVHEQTEKEASTFTGYPKPLRHYRLTYENFNMNLEEMYFWMITQLSLDQQYPKENIIKITDIFSASEMSSYWGTSAQRLAIQQDRASQYLKFIADMVKTMFQLIRDLNIVDEKLSYYDDAVSEHEDKAMDAEIVLKGQFADLVEGGPKNPQSIFGMAQQFNFVTLPNLFFQTRIPGKNLDEIKKNMRPFIQKLPLGNPTFKDVLERKLSQYYTWRYKTHEQLRTYRKLYKSYLKQHYNSIRLYMQWVKPYLRNIRRLSPSSQKSDSADLVAAFEGEMIEIEVLAHKSFGDYHACMLLNFDFRTQPHMEWVPNSQERRPVMVGRAEMNIKAYAWPKELIKNYQMMKEEEDLDLMQDIDESIKEALDAVKDDIQKYIHEKDGPKEEKKEEKKKWSVVKGKIVLVKDKKAGRNQTHPSLGGIFEPFIGVFLGLGELLRPFGGISLPKGKKSAKKGEKAAAGAAKATSWLIYKFYKKAHRLLAW